MEPIGALGEYFSGSRLALAQSCSRRHHVESAFGCGSYRLIARGDCAETPICFLRRKGMVACACSRVRLIGAWRPLALAGGVTTAVRGCIFYGELAQLGERMAGSHEVRGSNPLFSTMNSIAGRTIGQRFFLFPGWRARTPRGSTVVLIPLRANFLKRG